MSGWFRSLSYSLSMLLACSGAQGSVPSTESTEPASPPLNPSQSTPLTCTEVGKLTVCPNDASLVAWAAARHVAPVEPNSAATLDPADPLALRDGLALYEDMLAVALRTRTQLDLLENTPIYSATEVAWLTAHPDVWETAADIRAAEPGREQRDRLRDGLETFEDDPQAIRHLVLRDGMFYFEDPFTAAWAARELTIGELFDEPTVVLQRGTETYLLERGGRGHYYHTEPGLEGYRARLTMMDRVGLPGELGRPLGYGLPEMSRQLGLSRLDVSAADGAGRPATAVWLSGQSQPARLVRLDGGASLLGVVGDPAELATILSQSERVAEVIYGIRDTTEAMVYEDLFFDEPANEEGQQDGIMRLAFMDAIRSGALEYTVNGVTYPLFDDQGRPRPPQVCIDFITDAVERFAGSWWPSLADAPQGPRPRTAGTIDIRDLMTYRQVRELVTLAQERPDVASLVSFDADERVAYSRRDDFLAHLWSERDQFRVSDVVVIYGLRNDNRNHYHSFYVFQTDPLHGMPITLADNAGHARIRSWDDIMSAAPLRSVHHLVRWNESFLLGELSALSSL